MTGYEHTALVWATCDNCGAYLQLWSHGAEHPDAQCLECDQPWVRATVCERPRCCEPGCPSMADVERGGMSWCSWHGEPREEAGVRCAAE